MEEFLSFAAAVFEVDESEISMDIKVEEFEEWDSLMMMKLIMETEERYDVVIPIEEAPKIRSLNDLYQYTQK